MKGKEEEFEVIKTQFLKYYSFIIKCKYLFFIATLLGIISGIVIVKSSKSEYNAQITFLINDAKTNNSNPLAALASQFGAGGSAVNLSDDRILFLITTKRILGQSLLTVIDNQELTIADELIDVYNLRKGFKKDSSLVSFIRFKNLKLENLSYQENKIINLLIKLVIKSKDLQFESVKKKSTSLVSQTSSGIIVLGFKSQNELLSKIFVESIYNNLSSFYTNAITKNLKSNLDLVSQRVDSTQKLMLQKEFETANELDINNNIIKNKAKVGIGRMKRDAEMLNVFYTELIKNKEIAKFNYDQEKPVFEIIDSPSLPLDEINKSYLVYIVGSTFLFTFITLLILSVVYLRKYFK
jgi:hypothetical protein